MQDRVHDTAANTTAAPADLYDLHFEIEDLLNGATDLKLLTTIRDALRESARNNPIVITDEQRAWIASRVDGWAADIAAIRAGGKSYTIQEAIAETKQRRDDRVRG